MCLVLDRNTLAKEVSVMNQTASPDWEVLLEPFQSLFSKPGFRYFCVFVRVLAHLDGRLWVTWGILSGLLARHWTNFYRFLRSPAWGTTEVAQRLFTLCLLVCQKADERVFVAVDDTVCQKQGKHFAGLGVHHDPMNKHSARHLWHGHCFVCLALLARQAGQQTVALFLACALYVSRKACPQGQVFATKLQLAARMVADLPAVAPLIVVAEGAYAKQPFVQALEKSGRFVFSRLRRDAVF
jgi:hypothetical protein